METAVCEMLPNSKGGSVILLTMHKIKKNGNFDKELTRHSIYLDAIGKLEYIAVAGGLDK